MLLERVIPIDRHEKKKIAIYISRSDGKGTYPARRAAIISQALATEMDILFLCGEDSPPAPAGFKEIKVGNSNSLLRELTALKPDLLIRDSGSTIEEEVEKIREIVPSIIHFDDFGDGGKSADLVFQTLYSETIRSHARTLYRRSREFHRR